MKKTIEGVVRQGTHILFLDHLRGIAILLVLAFHSFSMSDPVGKNACYPTFSEWRHAPPKELIFFPFSQGWVGVPIFFAISGLCIHLSHVKSREAGFRTFYIRRFFRIYPPYLVALLFFALVLPVSRLHHSFAGLVDFLMHLFLLQNLYSVSIYTISGAFWSIAVEVQLYLLYPLLLWLVRRLGWNRCLLLLCILELASTNLQNVPRPESQLAYRFVFALSKSPLSYWFSWSIGARIADDWLAGRPIFLGRAPLWLGLAGFEISNFIRGINFFSFMLAALTTGIVLAKLLSNVTLSNRLTSLPFSNYLRNAGLVSYSAYLLHEPFLVMIPSMLPQSLNHSRPVVLMCCFLEWPLIFLISWAFYRFLELPSVSLGRWTMRKLRGSDQLPVQANRPLDP